MLTKIIAVLLSVLLIILSIPFLVKLLRDGKRGGDGKASTGMTGTGNKGGPGIPTSNPQETSEVTCPECGARGKEVVPSARLMLREDRQEYTCLNCGFVFY